ncbi:hypothetical protein GCM10022408_02910 [Hymenobacter fastidiosus]|uniref:BLUF domain-containing protein n=1 Tax=Hymenobacter fastidiosus TaxID=486264 RepID=A0ABP7RD55_9BACT
MHHIVYQSCAVGHPTRADLRFLLQQSHANNSQLGITGLLLYGNDNFLQVLEGPAAPVQQLYDRIRADHRHTAIITLADGAIEERVFMDWSMGFQRLSDDDFLRLIGYLNPHRADFSDPYPSDIDEGMLVLLKSFVVNDGVRW